MLDQGPSSARPRIASVLGRETKLYVAINITVVLPWPMPTYSSLENIFKYIISQNPENLDLAEGVCMYCLTNRISGFMWRLAWRLAISVSLYYVTLLG